jgi:hypothetical protein
LFLAKITSSSRTNCGRALYRDGGVLSCGLAGFVRHRQRRSDSLGLGLRAAFEVERGSIEGCICTGVAGHTAFADGPLVGKIAAASRRCSRAGQLSGVGAAGVRRASQGGRASRYAAERAERFR